MDIKNFSIKEKQVSLESTTEAKTFSNTCNGGQVWSSLQEACIDNPCDLEFEVFNEETENCDPIGGLCSQWDGCQQICAPSNKRDCADAGVSWTFFQGGIYDDCIALIAADPLPRPPNCKKCYYCTGTDTYDYVFVDTLELDDNNSCASYVPENDNSPYYNDTPEGCKACYGCDYSGFTTIYAKNCTDISFITVQDVGSDPGDRECCQGTGTIVQGRYNADGHRICCNDEKCNSIECPCPALYHGYSLQTCLEVSIDTNNFNEEVNFWTQQNIRGLQPGPCPLGAWCLDTDSKPENFESLSSGGGGGLFISPCSDREAACSQGDYGSYLQSAAGNADIIFVENGTCQDFPSTTAETIYAFGMRRPDDIFEVQRSRFPIACCLTPTPTPTASRTPTVTPTPTISPTLTETVTVTPTPSVSSTVTPTLSKTPTRTTTRTPTLTLTATLTPTRSLTPSVSKTPTKTPTPTTTQTPTATTTATQTLTRTSTRTPTRTGTQTKTPTRTPTSTPTVTATPTPTVTVTRTGTQTRTPTRTPTPTTTPTKTATPTRTPTSTPTSTSTSTRTATPTPTSTSTATATPTPSSSYTTGSGQWYKELP